MASVWPAKNTDNLADEYDLNWLLQVPGGFSFCAGTLEWQGFAPLWSGTLAGRPESNAMNTLSGERETEAQFTT